MCVYFCIGFTDFMLKDKSLLKDESLLYYTNLFSSKIISITKKMKKLYCVFCGQYIKFEKPKISYLGKSSSFYYMQ